MLIVIVNMVFFCTQQAIIKQVADFFFSLYYRVRSTCSFFILNKWSFDINKHDGQSCRGSTWMRLRSPSLRVADGQGNAVHRYATSFRLLQLLPIPLSIVAMVR